MMAKFTFEELYYGDKYNIMGNAAAEMLHFFNIYPIRMPSSNHW